VKVLLIDNYDSFTYNLFQLIGGLGADVIVKRNDAITIDEVETLDPTHVVLSPGPGHPARPRDFGVCAEIIRRSAARPLLGVCLGHQGMAHHLGGKVTTAPEIMHGKVSRVRHDGTGPFRGLPQELEVMRYHSLTVDPDGLPSSLRVTATTSDGVVMGLAHRELPMFGLQFHPESIGTPLGARLMASFLETS
jgi:anthranilate synthase component 2